MIISKSFGVPADCIFVQKTNKMIRCGERTFARGACRIYMEQDKRSFRQLKRDLKRAGNRKRRRQFQRELLDKPDDAPYSEFQFGRRSTAGLNGNDEDATRRKKDT